MRVKFSNCFLLNFFLCATVPLQASGLELRVKRQAGYVYDKPRVSFDLPSQPSTVSTQAPNVDRTLEQQMFYAYPVPSGGNTVTTGQGPGTTATATAGVISGGTASASAGAAAGSSGGSSGGYSYGTSNISGGYNYGPSSAGTLTANAGSQNVATGSQSAGSTSSSGSGYGYNAPSPSRTQATNTGSQSGSGSVSSGSGYGYNAPSPTRTQITNSGSQNAAAGSQLPGPGSALGVSGYDYNTPNPTLSPTLQGVAQVSTSAPRYLPPTSGGGGGGGSVNFGSVSVTSGPGQVTGSAQTKSVSSGSIGVPFDQYLPSLGTSGQVSSGYSNSGQTSSGSIGSSGSPFEQYLPPSSSNTSPSGPSITSTSIGIQNNGGGSLTIPGSGYLSPNSLPSPSLPAPGSTGPSGPAITTQNYLPPGSSSGSTGSISTPAATYLPPVF